MLYTPGRYNINFDIGAILLGGFMILEFLLRKKARDRRSYLFLTLVLVLIISAFGQMGTALIRNGTLICSNGMKTAVTVIAHYFHNSISFLLVLYLFEILGRLRVISIKRYWIIAIPQMVLTAFLFIPPLCHLIFYYNEEGAYCHGILYSFFYYVVVLTYVIIGVYLMIRYRNALARRDLVYAVSVALGFFLSMLVSVVDSYFRITVFLQMLCMLAVYFTIENDDETYDSGTGLLSRYSLLKETNGLYASGTTSYVISVKARKNEFYDVTLGADISTGLIRTVSSWMGKLMTDRIRVYHPGKDLFTVVLFNSTKEEAKALAEKIRVRFTGDWVYHNTPASYVVQILLGQVPDQIQNPEQMISFIDKGYDTHLPNDHVLNADSLIDSDARRTAVEMALHRAINSHSFMVYYQPIYDTVSGRIRSAEALVRMNDKELGFVSPEEFIKVAEQAGLISEIGETVFEEVCRFLSENRPDQYGLDFTEVNLSTIQCMDIRLPGRFKEIMEKYKIRPDQINLEITESAVIGNEEVMKEVLNGLLEDGFHFSLDDFGTGNSNYNYILKYPFALIKIDKSFLWEAEKNPDSETILKNMLSLIRGLHRNAVVEGVETLEQKTRLISDRVRYLQGYYYSKPIPGKDFLLYLRSFNAKAGEGQPNIVS